MNSLAFASIKELQDLLETRKISSRELVEFFIKRFELHDQKLGSALEIFSADSVLAQPHQAGRLAGVPGLIKDNICQKDRALTCASKILAGYRAPYDATVIELLKKEGALLLGRANMDEFAMGGSTETSAYKKTCNPWNLSRVPGGSSGGSIAAVAAGLAPWALGTETGGSVRQPAALCGIVGSKPTYGRISRYGLVAYGSSLDQVGIATRTVYDNALLMSILAAHDKRDATTRAVPAEDYTKHLNGSLKKGLKIGVIDNAVDAQGVEPDVKRALENVLKEYERLGATIVHLKLPTMDYGAATYFMLSRAEAASNLARFDGIRYGLRAQADSLSDVYTQTRQQGFGKEVIRRIIVGTYVLSKGHADAYYKSAEKVRSIMRQEFMQAFEEVDVLFSPVSPSGAFKFGAFDDKRLLMDLQDYFVAPANLVGIPALSIPCGFTQENLPIGFQLFGKDFSEALLFQTAHAYESVTPWHKQHPAGFTE